MKCMTIMYVLIYEIGHSPERPHICSVCKKGFKRKEHLNLHFVIHSGDKTEVSYQKRVVSFFFIDNAINISSCFFFIQKICGECGKGFYRKDHLRKHTKSHQTKRLKEEMNAQAQARKAATSNGTKADNSTTVTAITTMSMPTLSNSNAIDTNAIKTEITATNCSTDDLLQQIQQQQQVLQLQGDCQTICLHVSYTP